VAKVAVPLRKEAWQGCRRILIETVKVALEDPLAHRGWGPSRLAAITTDSGGTAGFTSRWSRGHVRSSGGHRGIRWGRGEHRRSRTARRRWLDEAQREPPQKIGPSLILEVRHGRARLLLLLGETTDIGSGARTTGMSGGGDHGVSLVFLKGRDGAELAHEGEGSGGCRRRFGRRLSENVGENGRARRGRNVDAVVRARAGGREVRRGVARA